MVHILKKKNLKKQRNFLRLNHTEQDQEMRRTLSWGPLSPPGVFQVCGKYSEPKS